MESPAVVVKFYYISVVYLVIFRWGGTNPISKDFPLLLLTKSNISLSLMLLQLDKRKGNDSIHKKESCTCENARKKSEIKVCQIFSRHSSYRGSLLLQRIWAPKKSNMSSHCKGKRSLTLFKYISVCPKCSKKKIEDRQSLSVAALLGNDERFILSR